MLLNKIEHFIQHCNKDSPKKYKEIGTVIDYIDEALRQRNTPDPNNTTESLFANAGLQYASFSQSDNPGTSLNYDAIVNKLAGGLEAQSLPDFYSTKHITPKAREKRQSQPLKMA